MTKTERAREQTHKTVSVYRAERLRAGVQSNRIPVAPTAVDQTPTTAPGTFPLTRPARSAPAPPHPELPSQMPLDERHTLIPWHTLFPAWSHPVRFKRGTLRLKFCTISSLPGGYSFLMGERGTMLHAPIYWISTAGERPQWHHISAPEVIQPSLTPQDYSLNTFTPK